MKHYFHFICASALLLGSLILLNNQQGEYLIKLAEHPPADQMELLADLPPNAAAESLTQSIRLNTNLVYASTAGMFRQLKSADSADNELCIKRQMKIHFELKPLIARASESLLLHRPSNEDPPVS